MLGKRPYVISIAGFDPSAGAGILADVKCFEQHRVYGFGVCSALTVQLDDTFMCCDWMDTGQIIAQLEPLFEKFQIAACKIGVIKDISVLHDVLTFIRAVDKDVKLVLDPVLTASSGFEFHNWNAAQLMSILPLIDLISPNYNELEAMGNGENVAVTAELWSTHCPVLLKGGHNRAAIGTDMLYMQDQILELKPGVAQIFQKHGSGCVLSAAITANLALGSVLPEACRRGKTYIEKFLNSNDTLLGYHKL